MVVLLLKIKYYWGDIMDKNIFHWVLNEISDDQLRNICDTEKIKIPGFSKNKNNAPKQMLVKGIINSKKDFTIYLKTYFDVSKEKDELENKSVLEIEKLINYNEKDKMIKQVVYLSTCDVKEYMELADLIINKIIENKNKKDEDEAKAKEQEENANKIQQLNELIKKLDSSITQLKNENKDITNKNKELCTEIKRMKKESANNEGKFKCEIIELNKIVNELKEKNNEINSKYIEISNKEENISTKDEKMISDNDLSENIKKILVIGKRSVEELNIPKKWKSSISILCDMDNKNLNDKSINKFDIIWVFGYSISTQTESKFNKLRTSAKTIRFNNINEYKEYIRKEDVL